MSSVQLVAPSVPPITLTDAKNHLRVTSSDEDQLITDLSISAVQFLERETGLALINQTIRFWVDDLPTDNVVCLPKHPVERISQIIWYDASGSAHLLSGNAYFLNTTTRPARLTFDRSACPAGCCNGIEIDFEAGFGTAGSDVPDMIKRALLVLIAHWYEFRGVYGPDDQPVSVPPLFERLVRHYRPMGL